METQHTVDTIAARAYEIYEREGCIDGRDQEHWFQAIEELNAENAEIEIAVGEEDDA